MAMNSVAARHFLSPSFTRIGRRPFSSIRLDVQARHWHLIPYSTSGVSVADGSEVSMIQPGLESALAPNDRAIPRDLAAPSETARLFK
jgi:hypothetical protein